MIVKHANPCGVAVAETIEHAYARALAADPVSAFGCVLMLNRPVDGPSSRKQIAEHFVEVVFAPEYDDDALEALRGEAGAPDPPRPRAPRRHPRTSATTSASSAACSSRSATPQPETATAWRSSPASVDDAQWADLLFAWRVCKHVSSNAIVLAKDGQTIGIGAGQMSRVDARADRDREGAGARPRPGRRVLASDAFFPFADGPQLALDAGVTAIIQPGGSKRDDETVAGGRGGGRGDGVHARRHFRH